MQKILNSAWLYRIYILIFSVIIVVVIGSLYFLRIDTAYISVVCIGGSVGAVELIGRYLYAPVRAVFTPGGVVYIVVNMAAAGAAYYMIGPKGFDVFGTDAATSLATLKSVLLAGFGALAFLRSSFFKVRVGDSSIGIGPAAILDTLLMVADRGVDRQEAILRAREVTDLLTGVDPVKGAALLTSYCFALMQNVSSEEQQAIEEKIKKIASVDTYNPEIRLDLIALALSKVMGPTVLEAAVIALGDRLKKVGPMGQSSPISPPPAGTASPQQPDGTPAATASADALSAEFVDSVRQSQIKRQTDP